MYKGSEVFMSKGILTKREKEVFSLLVDNKSTKEIADILISQLQNIQIDAVAAIESRGFLRGSLERRSYGSTQ